MARDETARDPDSEHPRSGPVWHPVPAALRPTVHGDGLPTPPGSRVGDETVAGAHTDLHRRADATPQRPRPETHADAITLDGPADFEPSPPASTFLPRDGARPLAGSTAPEVQYGD